MAVKAEPWKRFFQQTAAEATGPERIGWRVNVETPLGIEAYGVLVAPTAEGWRARILTFPNVLWLKPGAAETIKFFAKTPHDAERAATDFIREHCRQREFTMRDELVLLQPGDYEKEALPGEGVPDRKIRFLPVLFGLRHPAERAGTGNLSEAGLFIITEDPAPEGEVVHLRLQLETRELDLTGHVRWSRRAHRIGRSPGMGVQLVNPPVDYVNYVRALG